MPIQRDAKGRFCSAGGTPVRRSMHVAIVLDASGSMRPLSGEVQHAYRELMQSLAKEAERSNVEMRASVFTFSDSTHVAFISRPIRELKHAPLNYVATGGTALFDAVGDAVSTLDHQFPADSYLVMVLTDGEECSSTRLNSADIRNLMAARQKCGNWTFTYQIPLGYEARFIRSFNIPADNVRGWEISRAGLKETMQATQSAVSNFTRSVASGQSLNSSAFYVTPDLSQVSVSQLKNNLPDLSARFKMITVEKECSVRSFVEFKTGKPYVLGSAYYQLMKKEEIQPQKEVLIQEKGNKAVYGGQGARALVGLPQGVSAKVKPGNHANFEIFVQSASTNRILPRGTKVLVDTQRQTASTPTWEKP